MQSSDVAPPQTRPTVAKDQPEQIETLTLRQQTVVAFCDAIAPQRDRWIARNPAYFQADIDYMRFLIPPGRRILEVGCGTGRMLAALQPARGVGIDFSARSIELARRSFPELEFHHANAEDPASLELLGGPFDIVVLSDTIGYLEDAEAMLASLRRVMTPDSRIVIGYYSRLWEPILRLAEKLKLKSPQPDLAWLATDDTMNLLALAGFEPVRRDWRQLLPKRLFGLGTLINKHIAPLPGLRALCLRNYIVARPIGGTRAEGTTPSLSIVIPCRNEAGNIEPAVRRLPEFGADVEILFVEGHSRDNTLEECRRVQEAYPDLDIKVMVQDGKGKGNAVRNGFAAARGDILCILDADLTVPPETLPKFYRTLTENRGEFVMGTRLVYPMEQEAMRFLNFIANHGFARIFSFLLNQRITDTLCGTKVLWRRDYDAIAANRSYFGDFDPFGDFDLIFGAAKLNLRIVEIPIRYAARSYGETQISRFTHGWLLVRMVVFAWRKLKAL